MTKIINHIWFLYCDKSMKRTPEKILERGLYKSPKGIYYYIPKGLRNEILKRLCHVNFRLIFDETTPNLLNQPKESVDYIMRICRVSKRTAYDYYTALLYINYHPSMVNNQMLKTEAKMFENFEKDGIDHSEIFKQE